MRIRRALPSDLHAVMEMSDRYGFEQNRDWKEALSSKETDMFLLVEGEKLIGFTGLVRRDWNETLQIMGIFVDPEYRERGLGLKLITFLIRRAKKTRYRCLIGEAPSRSHVVGLYKKAGFRRCGYNDRYYSNNGKEIAFWMSLDLS
jgi:ribosomal protein S18 acetylase RimI-like enzyme